MGGKRAYELMLEIGHHSKPLKVKQPNGYTHKWTVFVKGADGAKIEHCIQRVVFQLHDSFPNPHREITEPPFQVKETGYAGFEIPIEIYFKNREKPNHLVVVLDLILLKDLPNNASKNQKVSFYHPNREFEKCLIKTGAQMILMSKDKKGRSDSPPAKKQKSSSLIPSKDMNQPATLNQPHSQAATNPSHHNHSSTTTTSSSHHNSSSHHHSNSLPKPKTASREFLDVFGAPLLINNNTSNNNNKSPPPPLPRIPHKPAQSSAGHTHGSSKSSHSRSHHHKHHSTPSQPITQQATQATQVTQAKQPIPPDPFQIIQEKISILTDCDRLQKIVDIIEESGEWYNLTANKFEFDLKRLDKRTLYKIEKSLNL